MDGLLIFYIPNRLLLPIPILKLENCISNDDGGAIVIYGRSTSIIQNTKFTSNTATGKGGAFHITGGASVTLGGGNNVFSGNHANINTATNNGASTVIIIETAAGVIFDAIGDVVIGNTFITHSSVLTSTGATTSVKIETLAISLIFSTFFVYKYVARILFSSFVWD